MLYGFMIMLNVFCINGGESGLYDGLGSIHNVSLVEHLICCNQRKMELGQKAYFQLGNN